MTVYDIIFFLLLGWFIASFTIGFQLWITFTFFKAGDFTNPINEWVFSVDCPNDSIECSSKRRDTAAGWVTFSAVLALFLAPDLIDGVYLFYESCTSSKFHFRKLSDYHLRAMFGILLSSVPVMSIAASFVFLYATSISNVSLLKEFIGK